MRNTLGRTASWRKKWRKWRLVTESRVYPAEARCCSWSSRGLNNVGRAVVDYRHEQRRRPPEVVAERFVARPRFRCLHVDHREVQRSGTACNSDATVFIATSSTPRLAPNAMAAATRAPRLPAMPGKTKAGRLKTAPAIDNRRKAKRRESAPVSDILVIAPVNRPKSASESAAGLRSSAARIAAIWPAHMPNANPSTVKSMLTANRAALVDEGACEVTAGRLFGPSLHGGVYYSGSSFSRTSPGSSASCVPYVNILRRTRSTSSSGKIHGSPICSA